MRASNYLISFYHTALITQRAAPLAALFFRTTLLPLREVSPWQTAGIKYGATIARMVIERFPYGFEDPGVINNFKNESLAGRTDYFAVNGIRRSLREEWFAGAEIGFRDAIPRRTRSPRPEAQLVDKGGLTGSCVRGGK